VGWCCGEIAWTRSAVGRDDLAADEAAEVVGLGRALVGRSCRRPFQRYRARSLIDVAGQAVLMRDAVAQMLLRVPSDFYRHLLTPPTECWAENTPSSPTSGNAPQRFVNSELILLYNSAIVKFTPLTSFFIMGIVKKRLIYRSY